MSYIDIPEETLDVAWRAFCESEQEHDDYATALADALTAAAPLIVAAELRRMAKDARIAADWMDLIRRANELDPPGGAS